MSTASPTVAPKKATSHVSAPSVPLTGGLSQAVEDTEDTEDSVLEVEPAGSMDETELESGVELSVEEDDSLPAVKPGHSFSSIRESRAQFSSPTKGVPVRTPMGRVLRIPGPKTLDDTNSAKRPR